MIDELFGDNDWFDSTNMLYAGDILQLLRITQNAIVQTLMCSLS